ncbi:MAG: D-2-hydroxyacid dehydrogenase [Phycisphaerae bacterium]|nr:D-2-hydroxyacid dehydrogenase [Gemmatimonadaceae bacterium]
MNSSTIAEALASNAPKRIVVGSDSHAEMAAAVLRDRPDLEVRHAKLGDLTADDFAWGEAYLGFRRPALASMGNIRWVHSTGAGIDPWLYPQELPREILLTRSSESFGPMIAEWALARALAFTQQLLELHALQQQRSWAKRDIPMLAGTNALIVGTGDVGVHVARAFGAMGCDVRGVSRSGTGDTAAFSTVWRASELREVVRDARWIIVVLPLTNETRGLISREVLSHCTGAVLMNAGRGPVVEEHAIPEALEQGWLSGAALDVFEQEPLPAASPLWTDSRVMISPHIAGLTTVEGAVAGFVECLRDLEQGKTPKWKVDRERQY